MKCCRYFLYKVIFSVFMISQFCGGYYRLIWPLLCAHRHVSVLCLHLTGVLDVVHSHLQEYWIVFRLYLWSKVTVTFRSPFRLLCHDARIRSTRHIRQSNKTLCLIHDDIKCIYFILILWLLALCSFSSSCWTFTWAQCLWALAHPLPTTLVILCGILETKLTRYYWFEWVHYSFFYTNNWQC